jgi:phage terminase large subunit-like protein
MADKQKAAQLIIEHLRELGPAAKALVIGPDMDYVRNVMFDGASGLRTLYGGEFSATRPDYQMTHRGGGLLYVHTADRPATRLNGRLFSLVVSEVLWRPETKLMLETARLNLRIGSEPRWVTSQGMEYEG